MEILFCNSKSIQIFGTNLTEAPLDKVPEICQMSFTQLYENTDNLTCFGQKNSSQPLSIQDLILKLQVN